MNSPNLEHLLSEIERRANLAADSTDRLALVKAVRRATKIIVHDMPEMAYQAIIEERETGEIEKLPNSLQAKADSFAQELFIILSGEQKADEVPEPGDVLP